MDAFCPRPAPPPLDIVKWWYGKSDEERQAFVEAGNISEKVQENIRAVEHFARQHSYYIMCETGLSVRPLPPLSPRPTKQYSHAWLGDAGIVWLPCPVHYIVDYSGRYLTVTQREARRREAERLIQVIYTRTAVLLRDLCGTGTGSYDCDKGRGDVAKDRELRSARILVDVLFEASIAALCRLGLTDKLEVAQKQKALRNRAATNLHMVTAPGEKPKPVGVRRAEAWGCLGLWEILQSRATKPLEEVKLHPTSALGLKRQRGDEDDGLVEVSKVEAKPKHWQFLREMFTTLCQDASAARGEWTRADPSDGDETLCAIPCGTGPRIVIASVDVRHAIAKVLLARRTALRPSEDSSREPKRVESDERLQPHVGVGGTVRVKHVPSYLDKSIRQCLPLPNRTVIGLCPLPKVIEGENFRHSPRIASVSMRLTLGVLTEDEEARTALSTAVENQWVPRFENNDGPLLDVWLDQRKLFGLIERVAPSDFLQIACEDEVVSGECAGGVSAAIAAPHLMRVTDDVLFVLRLSSVPHTSLQVGFTDGGAFVNCTRIVMDYSAQLSRGMQAELTGSDAYAEYVRFR